MANDQSSASVGEQHAREYEKLRAELLDLSRRNPMLNYKHRPGSRQQLRFVDTTLDFVLTELIEKQRTPILRPLPPPEDVPTDEKTPGFLAAFGHAKANDLEYLMRLEGLNSVARQEESELYDLDIWLRQRVREQLGLNPRLDQSEIKLVDHARNLGIDPSYSLTSTAQSLPRLSHLQTMYLAEDLDPRISRISADARLSEQETGLSTLFLAIGFLRWFDGGVTDIPNFAPLLLLPVQIKKQVLQRRATYSLHAISEEPEINQSLRELLLRKPPDVPRNLPEFDADVDNVESYFAKVQQTIDGLKDWRIERYLTLGHFSFGRLAMFSDLDSQNWLVHPVLTDVLGPLMSGNDGGPVNYDRLMFSPDHNVDDDDVEDLAPLILSEADGSQHSAVVDVMSGKNLVIEGPPGTGKSQTITNVIANALFSGRTVLFLAEKQAALEVVKKRLETAGIGDFCLELHSHKAQRKEAIESLRVRCEISAASFASNAWRNDLAQLRSVRGRMGEYLHSLHARDAEGEESAFELFWSAIARRRGLQKEFDLVRRVDLDGVLKRERRSIHELRDNLASYASALGSFQDRFGPYGKSPWHSSNLKISENADADLFRDALENLSSAANALSADTASASDTLGVAIPKTVVELEQWLDAVPEKPIDVDSPILSAVSTHSVADLQQFAQLVRAHISNYEAIDQALIGRDPNVLKVVYEDADRLGVAETSPQEIADRACRMMISESRIEEAIAEFIRLTRALRPSEDTTLAAAVNLATTIEFSNTIPSKLYEFLAFDGRKDADVIESGSQRSMGLAARESELQSRFSMKESTWPSVEDIDACMTMCSAGWAGRLIGKLNGRRELAARVLKRVGRDLHGVGLLAELTEIRNHLVAVREFVTDAALARACGQYWCGLDTPFENLLAVLALRADFAIQRQSLAEVGQLLESQIFSKNSKIVIAFKAFARPSEDLIHGMGDWTPGLIRLGLGEAMEAIRQTTRGFNALASKMGSFGLSNYHGPVSNFASESNKIEGLMEIERQIATNPASKSIPVDSVLNNKGCVQIERATTILRSIQRLGMPVELKDRLLSADGANFSRALSYALSNVRRSLGVFSKRSEEWVAVADDSFRDYLNSPLDLADKLRSLLSSSESLSLWSEVERRRISLREAGLESFLAICEHNEISEDRIARLFDALVAHHRALRRRRAQKPLSESSGISMEQSRQRFRDIDNGLRKKQRDALRSTLLARQVPVGVGGPGPRKTWTELQCLRDEFMRQNHASIRDLMKRAGGAIQALKPCFMMSPLSLAKYLPAGALKFDLLVIDEASQMRPEDALGGLIRAKQIVVVGDPQQLPPSDFFSRVSNNDGPDGDGDGDDIDAESILDWCLKTYTGPRRLKWHYRSKCESLIGFSNREFYRGDLITFPSAKPDAFSIDLVRIQGNYKKGRNPLEAAKVVSAAIEFMKAQVKLPPEDIQTLGIVAINSEQRELILEEFNRLSNDPEIEHYLALCEAQTEARGAEEFFIKNLENVQGDERDRIMISLTYGPEVGQEKMAQRFGPINRAQGHRRLNVLFTRARQQITVFASMTSQHIVAEGAKRGVRVLHEYLRYIESRKLEVGTRTGRDFDSDFESEVCARLERHGFSVDPQVGVGGYRIDLGIRDPHNQSIYLAGIECDGAAFHSAKSSRDRDRIRESVLRGLGWKLLRVWSTDWFADPDSQTENLVRQLMSLSAQAVPQEMAAVGFPNVLR